MTDVSQTCTRTEAAPRALRVGILPVMLELYDRLAPTLGGQLEAFAREVAAGLSGDGLEVTATELAITEAQIRAAGEALTKQQVDLLVLAHVSYARSGPILRALKDSKIPLLLWPLQPMDALEPEGYTFDVVLANHGMHGAQDLANVLGRRGRRFGILYGHWQNKAIRQTFREWAQAACVVQAMRQSGPIVLGGYFEDMLDLYMDTEAFVQEMGLARTEVATEALLAEAAKIKPESVAEAIAQHRKAFDIHEGLSEAILDKAVRYELALRALLAGQDSKAVAVNFQALCNDPNVTDALHFAASVLMADGVGYGAEGDWVTAAWLRGLLAAGLPASFTEMFSVGYANDRLVLRHWGEGNPSLARSRPLLRQSSCNDAVLAEWTVVDMEFAPGEVTLINLAAMPTGQGQLLSVRGEVTADHLPAVDGPRAVFAPAGGQVASLLNAYAEAGGTHHLTLVQGDARPLLDKVSKLTGWLHVQM